MLAWFPLSPLRPWAIVLSGISLIRSSGTAGTCVAQDDAHSHISPYLRDRFASTAFDGFGLMKITELSWREFRQFGLDKTAAALQDRETFGPWSPR